MRASHYKIGYIISRDICTFNTTQRKSMIDMVDILTLDLLEFTSAVITRMMLSLQLCQYLLRGMFTQDRPFTSATLTCMNTHPFLCVWASTISLVIFFLMRLYVWTVTVGFVIDLPSCECFFSYLRTTIICPALGNAVYTYFWTVIILFVPNVPSYFNFRLTLTFF